MDESEYTQLSAETLTELVAEFNTIDSNGNGYLEDYELQYALELVGFKKAQYEIRDLIKKYDCNVKDGKIDFNEFKNLYAELRRMDFGFKTLSAVKPKEGLEGYGASSVCSNDDMKHSITKQEQVAFAEWINKNLENDQDCKRLIPLHPEGRDIAEKCKDGVIICKLINITKPGTIDERVINHGPNLSLFQKHENLQLAINSAKAIGCAVVNIGPADIENGTLHLLLGLLWQIIKFGLLSDVNVASHSELVGLISKEESLADLCESSPEALLIRWVNYHLRQSQCNLQIKNFTDDIKDSVAYAYLLEQIAPHNKKSSMKTPEDILRDMNLRNRAQTVINNAKILDAGMFVSATDIVNGTHNLNLGFVANLFKLYSSSMNSTVAAKQKNGLSRGEEESVSSGIGSEDQDGWDAFQMEETREEKTYRNWMNSMGVSPFVKFLYFDLRSGLVFFQLFDLVRPNSVNWKRVRTKFRKLTANMEKLENCNYAVELGRECSFSLVGVGGEDLHQGNVTLTLALVWQLMRAYTLHVLQQCSNRKLTEKDILKWVQGKLPKANVSGFNDVSFSDAHLILDLIDKVRPGSINRSIIKNGRTTEDRYANATYAINVARKIGANVYALPEDITEVKPKMLMTIFACLMVVESQNKTAKR